MAAHFSLASSVLNATLSEAILYGKRKAELYTVYEQRF
jgi:hypothetical protein